LKEEVEAAKWLRPALGTHIGDRRRFELRTSGEIPIFKGDGTEIR